MQILVVVLSAFTNQRSLESLKEAEAFLRSIEMTYFGQASDMDVNNWGHNLVLDAYSRVTGLDDREYRIREMMTHMEELAVIHQNRSIRPDKFSYAALLRAIMRDTKSNLLGEVKSLISTMEESSTADSRPDLVIYSMALDACSKCQDVEAPTFAEELLDRLRRDKSFRPDSAMYATLMKVYSHAGDPEKSEHLIEVMREEFNAGNISCRLRETDFRTAIIAWIKSERPQALDRAMHLFEEMIGEYRGGNGNCRPRSRTYRDLMTILSLSSSPGTNKLVLGQSILQSMDEMRVPWDLQVWNTFLRVCTRCTGDEDTRKAALQAASEVLDAFHTRDSAKPDSTTYIHMLVAGKNLILGDFNAMVDYLSDVFHKCAADGLVNEEILLALRKFLPPRDFVSLTAQDPNTQLNMKAVPYVWKRNAVIK